MKRNGNCWKCRSHHAPSAMALICAVGEGLNVSVWNESLFIEKEIVHTFKFSMFVEYKVCVLPQAL